MKASLILAASALTQMAMAAPFVDHGHHAAHFKRQVAVVTKIVQAPEPNIVYVDKNGTPMVTSKGNHGGPPHVPSPPQPTVVAAPPQPVPGPSNQAPAKAVPPPPPAPSAPAAPAAPAAPGPGPTNGKPDGGNGLGIVYSPYHADHSCKTKDQVVKDFAAFQGYTMVRSYGTDCDQVPNMIAAAKTKNMKIMLGVFDISQVSNEVGKMIQGVGNDWGMVTSVSIGNEIVNSKGPGMVQPVIQALNTARGMLKDKFKGPVVTVDTFNALTSHPELCHASDFAAANAHYFFDPNADPKNAGQWLKDTVGKVQGACGKNVVITETGWPNKGGCNGKACPSAENQRAAIDSIKSSFKSDAILFSAYNDGWKEDFQGSFGCEKFWGMMGDSSN